MANRNSFPKLSLPQPEKLGMSLSLLCGVHCLVTPVLLTFAPMAGGELFHDPLVEFLLLGLTAVMGLYFLQRDYRQVHRQALPLALLLGGLALAFGGHLAELMPVSVLGGGLLFAAFALNFRYVRTRHSFAAHG